MSSLRTGPPAQAAHAFRTFFDELRSCFFEREALLGQVELALLCREHVLVVGPPGTAKSAVASAVLGRIVDAKSGQPSLFAKQLSESTVQTDLVGPVDFKVLTETGRTEYITDDGMLGATHAFIDEVFDGRDMLLRSILNVLHERELKHGRRITAGRTECAIMTSNRYLSEVLARSPEVLLAFADRISFVCFVPKAFARPESRAAMLARATQGHRPVLRAQLTLQQLDVLQALVERVEVPADVSEALERLVDGLERALQAQVVKLPDYVPTKYFSQRSLVKALWALKAVVVRDAVYERPERPLVATVEDLDALRAFFLLGGPPPPEAEALIKSSPDPREKAQLEILRVEHRAFAEVMAGLKDGLSGGARKEEEALGLPTVLAAIRQGAAQFDPAQLLDPARKLESALLPGPRHPSNRAPLLSAAHLLVERVTLELGQFPWPDSAEGWGRWVEGAAVLCRVCKEVPELRSLGPALHAAATAWTQRAHPQLVRTWEGLTLEPRTLPPPPLESEVASAERQCAALERLATHCAPDKVRAAFSQAEEATRARLQQLFRDRAAASYGQEGRDKGGALHERLAAGGQELEALERVLSRLSSEGTGLRVALLGPLAARCVADALARVQVRRLPALSHEVGAAAELLRREGLDPVPALEASSERIVALVEAYVKGLAPLPALPNLGAREGLSGAAYREYRGRLHAQRKDGDVGALLQLEQMVGGASPVGLLSPDLRRSLFEAELGTLSRRVEYLTEWWMVLRRSGLAGKELTARSAEKALDELVASRFPQLVHREAEFAAIGTALDALAEAAREAVEAEASARVDEVRRRLGVLEVDVAERGRRLLAARAG
jgi:MoxR-like ATPase